MVKPRGASGAGENQRGPAVRAGGVQRTPVTCTPSAFSQKRLVGVAQGCLSGCCAAGGEEMGRELCSGAENYPLGSGALDPGWWSMSLVLFSLAFAPPAIALGQQGSAPWTHYPHALFPFFSAVKTTSALAARGSVCQQAAFEGGWVSDQHPTGILCRAKPSLSHG